MSLDEKKRTIRLAAQKKRDDIVRRAPENAGELLASNIEQLISSFSGNGIISGFLPIGTEIDIQPALNLLQANNRKTCLPVVDEKNEPLIFRVWRNGDELQQGPLKTRQPLADAFEVKPDVMLVPLLAYDALGNRIGWGGGFYDRTLSAFRMNGHRVIAIGVAYDEQQIDQVSTGEFDVAMDWVVTEKRILEIMKDGS